MVADAGPPQALVHDQAGCQPTWRAIAEGARKISDSGVMSDQQGAVRIGSRHADTVVDADGNRPADKRITAAVGMARRHAWSRSRRGWPTRRWTA